MLGCPSISISSCSSPLLLWFACLLLVMVVFLLLAAVVVGVASAAGQFQVGRRPKSMKIGSEAKNK